MRSWHSLPRMCGARWPAVEMPCLSKISNNSALGRAWPPSRTPIATSPARWKAAAPETDLDPVSGPDDPVVQIYTSGTTGFPKGVVLAHRSFYTLPEATGDQGGDWIDWRRDDISLISLPGFGIAGMGWYMHGFAVGATNVVMRMYVPEEAVRLIRDESVTITFVAPAMLRMMLDEPGVEPTTFKSLRKVAYGAAPITTELLQESLDSV